MILSSTAILIFGNEQAIKYLIRRRLGKAVSDLGLHCLIVLMAEFDIVAEFDINGKK